MKIHAESKYEVVERQTTKREKEKRQEMHLQGFEGLKCMAHCMGF